MKTENRVSEKLVAAGLRISKPEAWTRGTYARRATGVEVQPNSKSATSWDAIGAVYAELELRPAADSKVETTTLAFCLSCLQSAAARNFRRTAEGVNDSLTHDDVLTMFRAAIRDARSHHWPDASEKFRQRHQRRS
jgi:hypothetical protein